MKIMLDTFKTEKINGNDTSHNVNHKYFHERRIFCKICLLVRTPESFKDHKMPGGSLSPLHQTQSPPLWTLETEVFILSD